MIDALVGVALVLVACADALRWLRVAQREHYIAGSVTRFAARWRRVGFGLSWRGRTSKLVWTRRLRVLAVVAFVAHCVVTALLRAIGLPWSIAALFALALVPVSVDAALLITAPLERRLMRPFVEQATRKLRAVSPTIVAITGSYGKTSTKVVLAHLVAGTRTVSASPASFNNRAGLARAVNEGLSPGTEVFVAEMGTYGKGEIAELCAWCPPSISVMTAIGPVHLERFGTEDNILEAKSEITVAAHTVVLNVDDPRLAAFADRIAREKKVLRASAHAKTADVAVIGADDGADVFVHGEHVGRVDHVPTAPTNAACAIAVAIELGVAPSDAVARLASAPAAAHRLERTTAPSGVVVLDDTFNSNPAGAARALAMLAASGDDGGRRVLITPGMIELGAQQVAANEKFAADAGAVASIVGVVGRTNRAALRKGAASTNAAVELFANREAAVGWVRANLRAGDAVLYENDLPDHYP